MTLIRPFAVAAILLLQTGCVVHAGQGSGRGGPPPTTTTGRAPVPPPVETRPAFLTQAEAEGIALRMAAERGYQDPRFHHVQWKDEQKEWKIDLRGGVDGREAKLQIRLDARDGRVVDLKDKRGGKPDHAGKDDDKDKGKGKNKDKGHEKHGDDDDDDDDDDGSSRAP